jgi:hypothetical protein
MGMLSEDIQNDRGPIEHPDRDTEAGFQLALMSRRELVVEDHHLGQVLFG